MSQVALEPHTAQLWGSQRGWGLGMLPPLGHIWQWLGTFLGGCYWDVILVGRDQWFCPTFYNAQDSPPPPPSSW